MCKFRDGTRVVIGLYVQECGDVYEENTGFRTAKIVFLGKRLYRQIHQLCLEYGVN